MKTLPGYVAEFIVSNTGVRKFLRDPMLGEAVYNIFLIALAAVVAATAVLFRIRRKVNLTIAFAISAVLAISTGFFPMYFLFNYLTENSSRYNEGIFLCLVGLVPGAIATCFAVHFFREKRQRLWDL